MVGGGNLEAHGEVAIGKAQADMRGNDYTFRVGGLLWLVLALCGGLYSMSQVGNQTTLSQDIWAAVPLQIAALVIGFGVGGLLARQTRRKREADAREVREIMASEKARQMAEFMTSK